MNSRDWYHHRPAGSQHTAGGFVTDNPDRYSTRSALICHVYGSQVYGRLIAAAPDMLEALRLMVDATEGVGLAAVRDDAIQAARAAIKKARGES